MADKRPKRDLATFRQPSSQPPTGMLPGDLWFQTDTPFWKLWDGQIWITANFTTEIEVSQPPVVNNLAPGDTRVNGLSDEPDWTRIWILVNGNPRGGSAFVSGGRWTVNEIPPLAKGDFVQAKAWAPGKLQGPMGDRRYVLEPAGYRAGGRPWPQGWMPGRMDLDKFLFATESFVPVALQLTRYHAGIVGTVASTAAAYLGGGGWDSGTTALYHCSKVVFHTETPVALNFNMHAAANGMGGVTSSQAGYFCGGENPSPWSSAAQVSKLAYATETLAVNRASLSGTRTSGVGSLESSVSGFVAGGYPVPSSWGRKGMDTIEEITFYSDFVSSIAARLSEPRFNWSDAGISGESYGYFVGGCFDYVQYALSDPANNSKVVDKLSFANRTCVRMGVSLSGPTAPSNGACENKQAGYVFFPNPTQNQNQCAKLAFSNENLSTVARAITSSVFTFACGFDNV